MNRYHRQILLPQIRETGQQRLADAKVLIVGCGALGTVVADQLARAGVGHLLLADRDIVDETNLQRQVLFDETDSREGVPKALAAAKRLTAVNSSISIEPLVVDVHSGNIEEIANCKLQNENCKSVDLIVDGTDNAQTRYLINDVSVKHSIPWIYGAGLATQGRVAAFVPPGPCLRCVFPEAPASGELPTCDTAGVLGPVTSVVGSLQALAAIKLLTGAGSDEHLLAMNLWENQIQRLSLKDARRPECPTCGQRNFEFLAKPAPTTTVLCGGNAVQILSPPVDLNSLRDRLNSLGRMVLNRYFLRCQIDAHTLTLFPDGRLLVQGTTDPSKARSLYDRYIGS